MAAHDDISTVEEDWADFRSEPGLTPVRRSRMFSPDTDSGHRVVGRIGYLFASDYFMVDRDTWASVCDLVHDDGVAESFPPFWPIRRIPTIRVDEKRGERAEVSVIDVIDRKSQAWIDKHLPRAGKAIGLAAGEVNARNNTLGDKNASRVKRAAGDIAVITSDIANHNAAYLHVQMRLLVKANSLELLDRIIADINRQYAERFATFCAVARPGAQESGLKELVGTAPDDMAGRGLYFTSIELGGTYSLISHGIKDPGGEYVGRMYGDYSTSTVLIDFNRTHNDAVVAIRDMAAPPAAWLAAHPDAPKRRLSLGHLWGAKFAQAALLGGHKVVQFGLDETDVSAIGMPLAGLTATVDVGAGEVNMFEMFDPRLPGEEAMDGPTRRRAHLENLPAIYSAQINKITAMTSMLTDEKVDAMVSSSLAEALNLFYTDRRMYRSDPKHHLEDLRLIVADHATVPSLANFTMYLGEREKFYAGQRDLGRQNAYAKLHAIYSGLLDKDGSLFNTTTSDSMDRAATSRRVIYDFSKLLSRGRNVALAQLVNVFGFAVGHLEAGDKIILHGAETISASPLAMDYIREQQANLRRRGVETVWVYSTGPTAAIADAGSNHLEHAGMAVFGQMSAADAHAYEGLIAEQMPDDLFSHITSSAQPGLVYVHRGSMENVLFVMDLLLGYAPARARHRAAILGSDPTIPFTPAG